MLAATAAEATAADATAADATAADAPATPTPAPYSSYASYGWSELPGAAAAAAPAPSPTPTNVAPAGALGGTSSALHTRRHVPMSARRAQPAPRLRPRLPDTPPPTPPPRTPPSLGLAAATGNPLALPRCL